MNELSILVKDLSKSFKKQQVLKNVDLELKKSRIIGMVGPNGSGKTTLIRILSQLISFDSGFIEINEKTMDRESIKNISVYLCESAFYPNFTGLQNLSYFLSKRESQVINNIELFKSFDMQDTINKKYGSYSMGMKQRFGLIFLLLQESDYLLLDEPMSNLDFNGVKELKKQLLKAAKEEEKGILIVSHHLEDLEDLCDELVIIEDGVIRKVNLEDKQTIEYDIVFKNSANKDEFKKATNFLYNDISDIILRIQLREENMIEEVFTDNRVNKLLLEVKKVKNNLQKSYMKYKGMNNYEE